MYSVTREPITDSDIESLRRSYGPKPHSAWFTLGVAAGAILIAIVSGSQAMATNAKNLNQALGIGLFISGAAVAVFAIWNLFTWFQGRRWRVAAEQRYEQLLEVRSIEVVHFLADAAWRIPEDPFDDNDDRLGVLYRVDKDAFATTPLYEFSLSGTGARVPAEVRMRRTSPPNSERITEYVPVNSETLPLRDELAQLEGPFPVWADNIRESAVAGRKLQLSDFPESWKPIVGV